MFSPPTALEVTLDTLRSFRTTPKCAVHPARASLLELRTREPPRARVVQRTHSSNIWAREDRLIDELRWSDGTAHWHDSASGVCCDQTRQ